MGKLVLTKSLMMATLMSGLFNYKKKKKKEGTGHEDRKYEVHAQITSIRHLRTSEPVWLVRPWPDKFFSRLAQLGAICIRLGCVLYPELQFD